MRVRLLLLLGISLTSGCTLVYDGTRNLIHEPCEFIEQRDLRHHVRKQGKQAWSRFAAQHPEWGQSLEFEDGFIDGFADYLDNGGKGDPPAIPPPHYRKNKYLTPEGFQAIDRYFAGFASGIGVAKDSGLRETLVVPVLVPEVVPPPPITQLPSRSPSEILPIPRKPMTEATSASRHRANIESESLSGMPIFLPPLPFW